MKRNSQAGFTLLEILLAIALVALIATALIAGSASLLNAKSVSADDIFWQAVGQARKTALQGAGDVKLSFDDDQKAFIVDNGTTPQPVPVPGATKMPVPGVLTTHGSTDGSSALLRQSSLQRW